MYRLTDNPELIIRVPDGTSIPRGHRWWPNHDELVSAVPAITLPEAKELAQTRIIDERHARETAGFSYQDKVFDSDPRAVQRLTTAAIAAQSALATNSPFEIEWTAADNSTVTLNATELLGMPVALATHAASLHNTARQLKGQIESATTVEEVESIQWP